VNNREFIRPSARELMELHVEAMFTHDPDMRLRTINEPWPGEDPAPRFFLGRTIDGTALCRFRYDVPEKLIGQLEALCADEPAIRDFQTMPKHFEAYMELLQGERFTRGPCYLVPDHTVPDRPIISINRDNIADFIIDGFEWLASEIDYAQPCIALVYERRIVSVCRSVRIASGAHEAGLETLDRFRGKGYAASVAAGWAMVVRKMGSIPLYSTLLDNLASQQVARKSALIFYGTNFTVT